MKIFQSLLAIALLAVALSAAATDLAKEKRWAEQVVDALLDGDAVWLNNGKSKFLGIYTEAIENKDRAVIIMHGTGIHPDWQQVIQPLRVGLSEHNWNTLSIQMPILANDAAYIDYAPLYDEVAPRIDAAIRYLKENGAKTIVLIGHSQGAAMTAYYLTITDQKKVNGFVAIGMAAFAEDVRMNAIRSLEKISVPVFDLYGNEDLDNILASAGARQQAATKAGNKNYSQKKITGNHFYDGHEDVLLKIVANWLESISVQ